MKVLFVCTGNSFRSPIAEALLKKLRRDFTVESAGIEPARWIAHNAKEFLKEENALGYLKTETEGLEEKKVEEYDVIIAMKEEHKRFIIERWPKVPDKIQVWDIDDPIYLPAGYARNVFERIKMKVHEMAETEGTL